MGMWAGLIRKEQDPPRALINITLIQSRLLKRSEGIEYWQYAISSGSRRELQDGLAVVFCSVGIGSKCAISGHYVDVATTVKDRSATALPYATQATIRRGIECGHEA